MKIISIRPSEEVCQQAGWRGVDVFFDSAVEEKDILRWVCLGQFIYLDKLKEPFFKISGRSYMIKGFLGREKIKIGYAQDEKTFTHKVEISRFLMIPYQ